MINSVLVLLCGLPGAGKSRLAAGLLDIPKEVKLCLVSVDAFLVEGQGELPRSASSGFEPGQWHASKKRCLEASEALLTAAAVDPSIRIIILVEDNFYYASMRKAYCSLARRCESAVAIWDYCFIPVR